MLARWHYGEGGIAVGSLLVADESNKHSLFFCISCLGSTQHLKNLYGAGYTLEVKLKHIDFQPDTASSASNQSAVQPAGSPSSSASLSSPPTPSAIPASHGDPLQHHHLMDAAGTTVGAISTHSVESAASSSCPLNQNRRSEQQAAKPASLPAQPTSFDVACDERQERRSAVLRQFVVDLFPDACLEESFADRLVYSVPQHAVSSLAECFHRLERGECLRHSQQREREFHLSNHNNSCVFNIHSQNRTGHRGVLVQSDDARASVPQVRPLRRGGDGGRRVNISACPINRSSYHPKTYHGLVKNTSH